MGKCGDGCGRWRPDRTWLRGMGEEILLVVVQGANPAQLTDWLRLPLDLSAGDEKFWSLLSKRNECCQLRRQGEKILELVMERASSKQWVKWLQIPLDHARRAEKTALVRKLEAAGAVFRIPCYSVQKQQVGCRSTARMPAETRDGNACGAAGARACSSPAAPDVPQPITPLIASSCCKSQALAPASVPAFLASCCKTSPKSTPAAAAVTAKSSLGCCGAAASAPSVLDGCALDGGGLPTEGAATVAARVDEKLYLHRATMAGDVGWMQELLVEGAVDKNATDLWSCTALHRAAEQDRAEAMCLLLAAGLDLGARDMDGYSPLHFAAARGASVCIVGLLAAGACMSDRGLNGDTPLHSAARFLSLSTLRLLLEAEADETVENEEGHTPAEVMGVLPDGREIEDATDPLAAHEITAALAAAPEGRKFRIWKRRAWVVMLHARLQARAANDEQAGTRGLRPTGHVACADTGNSNNIGLGNLEETMNRTPANFCGSGGSSAAAAAAKDDDFTGFRSLVSRVAGLPVEGVFRQIVLFL